MNRIDAIEAMQSKQFNATVQLLYCTAALEE
jgi:hypothetical protein